MKAIILIAFVLLVSGCIQEGKWFGVIGESVTIDNVGTELEKKFACAEEMERIMAEEGVDYKFNEEAIPEIISVSCRGDICLCQ